MSSKSDNWENGLLLLVFNNTTFSGVGSDGIRGSTTAGSLYIGLHTATPDEAGDQDDNETTYTGYSRVAVARASGAGGFTVTGNSVSPTDDTDFGECTALPGSNLQFFGIGGAATLAGDLLYYGPLTPNITMATGVIPRVKNTSAITES